MSELPNKMSELLRLAVKDAQACDVDPRYRLQMLYWHEPMSEALADETGLIEEDVCLVCMAGAVMAKTFEVRPDVEAGPDHPELFEARNWFFAIDDMRTGDFDEAYVNLFGGPTDDNGRSEDIRGEKESAVITCRDLVDNAYQDDLRRAPWEVYLEAANILGKAGL